jgi:DNA-binding response OmpR family regulator
MVLLDSLTAAAPAAAIREEELSSRLIRPRAQLLSVSGFRADHKALARMIDRDFWNLIPVRRCREALLRLNSTSISVVVCEQSLPDGTWREVFENLEAMAKPPALVVTSKRPDDHLWAEVLNIGGYDVLAKPFYREEVRRVLASASSFRREYRHRTGAAGAG